MATKKKEETTLVAEKKPLEYELVYIVSPEVSEEALENTVNDISQFITGKDGAISEVERWGKKKLAYPVEHFLEGNYVLTRFQMNPARCKELEANLKISEQIIRHLLIKLGE